MLGPKTIFTYSTKNCLITHALESPFHISCGFSSSFLRDLKDLRFSKRLTSNALILRSSLALAHSARISLSIIDLCLGIIFSVLHGTFFQKSPVSSQLKICWGIYPLAAIIPADYFEIILSCLHIRSHCLTMSDKGVNVGPLFKIIEFP